MNDMKKLMMVFPLMFACSQDADPVGSSTSGGIGSTGEEGGSEGSSGSESGSESMGESSGSEESGTEDTGSQDPAWIDVFVDGDGACGLHSDGRVTCWGCEESQWATWWLEADSLLEIARFVTPLGLDASGSPVGLSESIPNVQGLNGLSSGPFHSCALQNGEPLCWGQFGGEEVESPSGLAKQIVAGRQVTFALRETGEISVWGNGEAPTGEWAAICSGQESAHCGLRSDGEGSSLECWTPTPWREADVPSGDWVACDTSGEQVCLVDRSGDVLCADEIGAVDWQGIGMDSPNADISSGGQLRVCTLTGGLIRCYGDPCLPNEVSP